MWQILMRSRAEVDAGSLGPPIRSPMKELAFFFCRKVQGQLGHSLPVWRRKAAEAKEAVKDNSDRAQAEREVHKVNLFNSF